MKVVVGISGGSGSIYAVSLLKALKELNVETHLVVSTMGEYVTKHECGVTLEELKSLATYYHDNKNFAAPISSGSFKVDQMIVLPCSMKTLASVANGFSDSLIARACDVTLKEGRKLNIFEKTIKDSVLFVSKIIYAPIDLVVTKVDEVKEKNKLFDKFKKLKEKTEKIDLYETENLELKKEINELKSLLELKNISSEYAYLYATVINRNLGYWYNNITIDKGSYNGVKGNMAVINNKGLIGYISSTSIFNSTVKLLTDNDTKNKISVKIQISDDEFLYGLLSGYNSENKTFNIEGVSENKDIPVGSFVTTSGMGGIFPTGIFVGKVESVSVDNFGLSRIVNVKSNVDFDDINYVSVIKKEVKE